MSYEVEDIYECDAYACYLKNEEELIKSTSGGAFYGVAKYVIEKGGIVFGAVAVTPYEVRHMSASNLIDLEKIRKSKYVQSEIGQTYIEVQRNLANGRLVLFSGTPCQVAGLNSFLGRKYENLLTVDIICHGVPNSEILRRHIEHLEQQYGKLLGLGFRDKKNGWNSGTVKYELQDTSVYVKAYEDAYFYAFDQFFILRPSCYECPFRGLKSGADITIGDYWAIKKRHPGFENDNGVSAVILKTKQGKFLFESCINDFIYVKSDVRKIAEYNIFVVRSRGVKKSRKYFFELWKEGEKNYFNICKKIKEKNTDIKIGIIGSYSLRVAVNRMSTYDDSIKIAWHITNSSLPSMMANRISDYAPLLPADTNEYRISSIMRDVYKKAITVIKEGADCEYVLIDFLEERYPVYVGEHVICTKSDAFVEAGLSPDFQEKGMLEFAVSEWEEICRSFLNILLSKYQARQIILLRLFLTENIGTIRKEEKFADYAEIREINARLAMYYDFVEHNFPEIHVIQINNDSTDYCPRSFLYGCKPEYYNAFRYSEIKEAIVSILETSYE